MTFQCHRPFRVPRKRIPIGKGAPFPPAPWKRSEPSSLPWTGRSGLLRPGRRYPAVLWARGHRPCDGSDGRSHVRSRCQAGGPAGGPCGSTAFDAARLAAFEPGVCRPGGVIEPRRTPWGGRIAGTDSPAIGDFPQGSGEGARGTLSAEHSLQGRGHDGKSARRRSHCHRYHCLSR